MLTIRLTTVSSLRPARAPRRMSVRAPWLSFLALAFALIGISLTLHFTLHSALDLEADGHSAPSHQCPADHINLVHSGLRESQAIVERVAPDAGCATTFALEPAAPRYFDEAPERVLVSTVLAPILSARGPPARP